jgi:hypothetical protein
MGLSMTVVFPPKTELKALYPAFESYRKAETITVNNVYLKVLQVRGDKYLLHFELGYFSPDQSGLIRTEHYEFVPSVGDAAGDFIRQSYIHAKTLPQFAGAIDA